MTLGDDLLRLGVVQDELEIGELLVEPPPVRPENLAVEVVLGPDLARECVDALPQLRTLGVADDDEAHE